MRTLLTTTITLLIILLTIGLLNGCEAHYTRDVVVVDTECIKTVVKDEQGNLWVFNSSDYNVGDRLTLVMYDNHTTKITDDEIIKVKK